MLKVKPNKNGVVLFVVLGVVLMTATLATVILSLVLSHYRLTHHQSSRIQAYYASMAGVNYALEQLRTGALIYDLGPPLVNSCPNPGGCLINDTDFPNSILSFDGSTNRQVRIIFCPSGSTCADSTVQCNPPSGYNFCINITANYTYTPTP